MFFGAVVLGLPSGRGAVAGVFVRVGSCLRALPQTILVALVGFSPGCVGGGASRGARQPGRGGC